LEGWKQFEIKFLWNNQPDEKSYGLIK